MATIQTGFLLIWKVLSELDGGSLIAGSNLVGVLMIVESNPLMSLHGRSQSVHHVCTAGSNYNQKHKTPEIARRRAETDSLTGLFNHRHFSKQPGTNLTASSVINILHSPDV